LSRPWEPSCQFLLRCSKEVQVLWADIQVPTLKLNITAERIDVKLGTADSGLPNPSLVWISWWLELLCEWIMIDWQIRYG
jgi:hypothetical protein